MGRSAALCLHPIAGWRSRSRKDRTLLVISYVAVCYVVVFVLLNALLGGTLWSAATVASTDLLHHLCDCVDDHLRRVERNPMTAFLGEDVPAPR
jgi:hypothetical protein